MSIEGPRGRVKLIGLIGAESTGKSTLAQMLVGRLKTHGVQAALSAEAGAARPFPAPLLDSYHAAHFYTVLHKLVNEAHHVLMANADYVVCDRTPIDLVAYYLAKFPQGPGRAQLLALCRYWMSQYDAVYFLPIEGTEYVADGFRAAAADNTWRTEVDAFLDQEMIQLHAYTSVVEKMEGSFRLRAEAVYHHVLHHFFGKSRPLRAYAQVRAWLADRGWRIVEVRPQGSNSITRFHPASDTDDIDAMVIVDGDANYAIAVKADIEVHREQMENIVQANLDLLVTHKGQEAHEV